MGNRCSSYTLNVNRLQGLAVKQREGWPEAITGLANRRLRNRLGTLPELVAGLLHPPRSKEDRVAEFSVLPTNVDLQELGPVPVHSEIRRIELVGPEVPIGQSTCKDFSPDVEVVISPHQLDGPQPELALAQVKILDWLENASAAHSLTREKIGCGHIIALNRQMRPEMKIAGQCIILESALPFANEREMSVVLSQVQRPEGPVAMFPNIVVQGQELRADSQIPCGGHVGPQDLGNGYVVLLAIVKRAADVEILQPGILPLRVRAEVDQAGNILEVVTINKTIPRSIETADGIVEPVLEKLAEGHDPDVAVKAKVIEEQRPLGRGKGIDSQA